MVRPPSMMTAGEKARFTCQVPRTNDFFMDAPSSHLSQILACRSWFGRERRARHRAELDALHLLQQSELVKVDRAHAHLGAGAGLLVIGLGVLFLVAAAE